MALPTGITASFLLVLNTVFWCVPLFLLGILALPLPGRGRRWLQPTMDAIVQGWVGVNGRIFRALKLTDLELELFDEAQLATDRWYLVVSNHQSWTDIVLLQTMLWGRIPTVKFFTKRELIWVPLIGLAMWFLGFPYVNRASREQIASNPELLAQDRENTLAACEGFKHHPTSVLIFLEGTRFTAEKHSRQEARFQHLLNPKLGGLAYVAASLGDRLDALVDITLVYPDGVPSFWTFLQGRCPRVRAYVHCRAFPAALPADGDDRQVREQLGPWIENLWAEKDALLERVAA